MVVTAEALLEGQVLLIDKPLGWSSFQAVNKVKWALKHQTGVSTFKIGHAGTLDPLATGLLVLCTGKMTKQIPRIQDAIKTYTGTIGLGATTPSYDLETKVVPFGPTDQLTELAIQLATRNFTGLIWQKPPVFSAIKKDGVRLYEHARAGASVHIEARQVEVFRFDITAFRGQEVDFEIVCSKGTYIRSLAHDLGQALGCGGHLKALRRTAIGDLHVAQAVAPEAFEIPKKN